MTTEFTVYRRTKFESPVKTQIIRAVNCSFAALGVILVCGYIVAQITPKTASAALKTLSIKIDDSATIEQQKDSFFEQLRNQMIMMDNLDKR